MIFNIDSTVDNTYSFSSNSYDDFLVGKQYTGIIVNKKNFITDYYFGSDFSGFNIDFKTGKLGLKAFSGKGFYQGRVTEKYLEDNGFIKKEI